MRDDLTVENMFSHSMTEVVQVIPGMALGATDRKRVIEHHINHVVHQILNAPGTNPVGLTITVTPHQIDDELCLEVHATTPQYSLSDDFFTI